MDSGLNIKISTTIEDSKVIEKKLINTLNKVNASVKISNIEIDDKVIRNLETLFKNLGSSTKGAEIPLKDFKKALEEIQIIGNKALLPNGSLTDSQKIISMVTKEVKDLKVEIDKITTIKDSNGAPIKQIQQMTDQYGQQIKVVKTLGEESDIVTTTIIDNYKKQRNELEKNQNELKKSETIINNLKKNFSELYGSSSGFGIEELQQKLSNLSVGDKNFNSIISGIKQETNALNEELSVRNKIQQSIKASSNNYVLNKASENNANLKSSYETRIKEAEAIKKQEEEQLKLNEAIENYQAKMQNTIRSLQASKIGKFVPTEELNNFKKELSTITDVKSMDEFTSKTRSLNNQFGSLTASTRELNQAHYGLFSNLKHNIEMFMQFYVVTGGLISGINALKDGISTINELDKAQTNISMISGMKKEDVVSMTKDLSEQAKALGDTTKNLMDGAENFLRAGRSIADSKILITDSTMMSKISGQDQATLADQMIAVQNSYQFTSEQMEQQFVDKISALDSKSATSAKDISEAVLHTAQSAKLAGVSWDFLLTSVTNVMDTTKKSGSEVGNSIKNIFSRMENIAKGTNTEDDVTVNQVEKALNKQGIALRKNQKEWRSMEDVIKDVQAKWDKMSSVDQSEIVSKMGGAYNRETLLTLFENQKKSAELMNVLNESAGSGQAKYNEYLKSTEASLNRLKISMEQFWMSAISSGTIRSAINAITSLVDTLRYLTLENKTAGLSLVALGASALLLARNLNFVVREITAGTSIGGIFNLLLGKIFTGMATGVGITGILTGALGTLKATLSALFLTGPGLIFTGIAIAVGVATYAVTSHIKKQQELKQETESLKNSYNALTDSMKNNTLTQESTDVKTLQDAQDKLQKAIQAKKEANEAMSKSDITTGSGYSDYVSGTSEVIQKNKKAEESFNELVKELKDAGIEFDLTTGEIYKLKEAQNLLSQKKNAENIKKDAQAQFENRQEIMNLAQEYKNLSNVQDRDTSQKVRMGQVALELQKYISGLSVARDEEGNVVIQNMDLLNKEISILNTEGSSVENLTKVKLSNAKDDAVIETSKTTVTYKEAKKRIQTYLEEINAINALAESAKKSAEANGIDPSLTEGMGYSTGANIIYNRNMSEINAIQNAMKKLDEIYSSGGGSSVSLPDTSSYTPSDVDKNTKSTNASKEATDAYSLAISDLNNKLDEYDNRLKNVSKSSQEYRNILLEKQKLIQQEISLTQQQINLQDQIAKSGGGTSSYSGTASSVASAGSSIGQTIVQEAQKYIGTKYTNGGTSPNTGFDCSGLVQYVYKQLGIQLSRTTYSQVKEGSPVNRKDLQAGDLVFFGNPSSPGHVGIYAGNNRVLHSPQDNDVVKYSNIDSFGQPMSFRRIVSGGSTTSASSNTYSGKYASLINQYAKQYGLNPFLVAGIIKTESGFNPNAYNSSSGAMGLGQFLASTAREEGLTNPYDPEQAISHLASYLAKRIKWAGGDVNAGIKGYGEGTDEYLNKVLANAKSLGYGGTSISSTSSDTTVQDAQQKSLDLQNKLLDLQQQLAEIPYQIFESKLAEFDDKVTELEKRNDIIKNDLELETDGKKRADESTEIITNLEKELEINKEKQKYVEQEIASRNYTNAQLTEMNSKLLDIKKTETDIAVQVKQAYEEQLNTVKTVQEKIMEVIKKRYEEEKDLIQKQQDAYNKANETDDYNKNLTEEQKKLADIQKKIDMIKNDPTAKGKLADLMKEATDQQKSIDDMVLEHQRSLNNEMFDAQKDAIDEKAKDENLTQIVNNAIKQGFINLDGKIIDVKTAYIDFENRFGEGLKATGELLKTEFINKLSEAQSLIGSMQNINLKINATSGGGSGSTTVPSYAVGTTNISADTLAMVHAGESIIPASINPFNGAGFINMIRNQVAFAITGIRTPSISGTSKGNITLNMNQPFLVVQGNVDESMKGYLTSLINNKMKDITNEIKAICNSEGVY